MVKIDISSWGEFKIGDLFDIHPTIAYKMTNAQLMDGGENPVVVNSSYNNGIGGYTSQSTTENGNMITFSDTTTGDAIFYQANAFVGYPHVQGLYPIGEYKNEWTRKRLMFFVAVFKRASTIMQFDYSYKFTREIAANMRILLPQDSAGKPNFAYMDEYMQNIIQQAKTNLRNLKTCSTEKTTIDISGWKEFEIGSLFKNIVKPPVLHTRQVTETKNGIAYVVRTKFGNGVKCKVARTEDMDPSPAGVISFGAENATFFYQPEEFVSGRDIYYIDTQSLTRGACKFLTACLQPIARKYTYNYGLFPDLLKKEIVKLPVGDNGEPNWEYMDKYMEKVINDAKTTLSNLI